MEQILASIENHLVAFFGLGVLLLAVIDLIKERKNKP